MKHLSNRGHLTVTNQPISQMFSKITTSNASSFPTFFPIFYFREKKNVLSGSTRATFWVSFENIIDEKKCLFTAADMTSYNFSAHFFTAIRTCSYILFNLNWTSIKKFSHTLSLCNFHTNNISCRCHLSRKNIFFSRSANENWCV